MLPYHLINRLRPAVQRQKPASAVCRVLLLLLMLLSLGLAPALAADDLAFFVQGSLSQLSAPDYDWWYGCSPTAAGMIMGYYDRQGYSGRGYDNLVPGAAAEPQTFANPSGWMAAVNQIIASEAHVQDFCQNGYLAKNDDVASPHQTFNCLADFMGTSQDSAGNANGSTTFYYYTSGARLYVKDIYAAGSAYYQKDGMFGLWEYVNYAGYGSGAPATDTNFFTQLISTSSTSQGFTFANYKTEIDTGRLVMIHVKGHSMLGYGYDDATQTVYLHDTWSLGVHTMKWGGAYSGMQHWGVTCFLPTGGAAPQSNPYASLEFTFSNGLEYLGFARFTDEFAYFYSYAADNPQDSCFTLFVPYDRGADWQAYFFYSASSSGSAYAGVGYDNYTHHWGYAWASQKANPGQVFSQFYTALNDQTYLFSYQHSSGETYSGTGSYGSLSGDFQGWATGSSVSAITGHYAFQLTDPYFNYTQSAIWNLVHGGCLLEYD